MTVRPDFVLVAAVLIATAIAAVGLASPGAAQSGAQETVKAAAAQWPGKPVRVFSPLAAGGAVDVLGRAVGDQLSQNVKQPVVLENRPGAGGALAATQVARAAGDGYTLFLGTAGAMTITPVLSKKVTYDPVNDFTPLTIAVELPICLVVHASLPVNSVKEFIAYAKANPGKLSFGSSGSGTTHHLAGEALKRQAGIEMTHIPYRGGNPAMTDLLSGQIPVLFATLSTTLPHIKSGKFKVLGMVEASRSRTRQDIPTIGETVPGYAIPSSWIGYLAPAGLSAPLVQRISDELITAIRAPKVRATLEASGFELVTGSPAQFAETIKSSLERYRKIAAEAGIQPK